MSIENEETLQNTFIFEETMLKKDLWQHFKKTSEDSKNFEDLTRRFLKLEFALQSPVKSCKIKNFKNFRLIKLSSSEKALYLRMNVEDT